MIYAYYVHIIYNSGMPLPKTKGLLVATLPFIAESLQLYLGK